MTGTNSETGLDTRSPGKVLRQWKTIQEVKRALIREGLIKGDATTAEVISELRAQVPADLMEA